MGDSKAQRHNGMTACGMGRATPLRPWEKGLGDEVDTRRKNPLD
jgi:hypothetical protein